MRKRNRIFIRLFVLALCIALLPTVALALPNTVTFIAGGELFATVTVPHGDTLGNMPDVPELSGYTGTWDKNVDTVTADVTVTAIYTPIQTVLPQTGSWDLLWLVLPVSLISVLAMVITVKRKKQ